MSYYEWNGDEDLSKEVFKGDFMVSSWVESLKGCPKEVTGNFEISFNTHIEDLQGMPKIIGGKCNIEYNENLISLKGISKEINDLILIGLPIKKFDDFPQHFNTFKMMDCNEIENFEGINQNLSNSDGDLIEITITKCDNFKSLKGLPNNSDVILKIINSPLTDLNYMPKTLASLTLDRVPVKNLKGISKNLYVGLTLNECYELTSLKGIENLSLHTLDLGSLPKLSQIDYLPEYLEELNLDGADMLDIPVKILVKLLIDGTYISSSNKQIENIFGMIAEKYSYLSNLRYYNKYIEKLFKEISSLNNNDIIQIDPYLLSAKSNVEKISDSIDKVIDKLDFGKIKRIFFR